MNAASYLKDFGWRGEGFSLDTTDRGLAKPLLVQHKKGLDGLGAKKHDFSNQWWLSSFNKSLSSVGLDKIDTTATVVTTKQAPTTSGLYKGFVRGDTLSSTIQSRQSTPPISHSTTFALNAMAPSMSTVGAGFILGETPAQTAAAAASTVSIAVSSTRENKEDERKAKAKKEKDERKLKKKELKLSEASKETVLQQPSTSAKKEKKSKSKASKQIEPTSTSADADSVPEISNGVQITSAPDLTVSESNDKKSKKRKRNAEVVLQDAELDQPVRSTLGGEDIPDATKPVEDATISASDETKLEEGIKRRKGEKGKKEKKEKAEKSRKKRKDASGGAQEMSTSEQPLLDDTSASPKAAQHDTTNRATATSQDDAGTSTPSFIPLNDSNSNANSTIVTGPTQSKKKAKKPNMKSQKQIQAMKVYKNPDGTIDPFAISVEGAPGGNKLAHIPTVHPKTGKALTKKARKIMAKKIVKKENRVTREDVRERRKAKKIRRAEQQAAKDKAKAEAPKKPSRSIKYAREKAKRVAKRESKAAMANGVGSGANNVPVAVR